MSRAGSFVERIGRVSAQRGPTLELILASASPRRLELLRSIGIEPMVVGAAVDERPRSGESPAALVERLARAKAGAVAALSVETISSAGDGDLLVVGADTVIDLDGRILGKPADRAEAERMLWSLTGRSHGVLTGVAVAGWRGGRPVELFGVERTEVEMRSFGAAEVAWYLDSGEYDGKAGAYAIQGLGSLLVRGVDGSYQNVVGLPLTLVDRLLGELGLPLRELAMVGLRPVSSTDVHAASEDRGSV